MKARATWLNTHYLEPLFKRINSIRRKTDEGEISFLGFDFYSICEVLASYVKFQPSGQTQKFKNFVASALSKKNNRNDITHEEFLVELNILITKEAAKPPNKFVVASMISMKGTFPNRPIAMGNSKIVIGRFPSKRISSQHFEWIWDSRALMMLEGKIRERNESSVTLCYTPITISVYGTDEFSAYQMAWEQAERLRALLNFRQNQLHVKLYGGGNGAPANEIRWELIHTVHEVGRQPDGPVFWYETDYQQVTRAFNIDNSRIDFFSFVKVAVKALRDNPLQDIVWEALVRYCRALDRTDHPLAFRELWSVLELLTSAEAGAGAHAKIPSKIASMYRDARYHEAVLNHLRMKRNEITHSGVNTSNAERLLVECKFYVEKAINHLIYNPFKFQTIQEFSEFLSLPNDEAGLRQMELQLERRRQFKLHNSKRLPRLLKEQSKNREGI
jgi:hypothetical protein